MDMTETTERPDDKYLSFVSWRVLYSWFGSNFGYFALLDWLVFPIDVYFGWLIFSIYIIMQKLMVAVNFIISLIIDWIEIV